MHCMGRDSIKNRKLQLLTRVLGDNIVLTAFSYRIRNDLKLLVDYQIVDITKIFPNVLSQSN
jgi:hypothetical protein